MGLRKTNRYSLTKLKRYLRINNMTVKELLVKINEVNQCNMFYTHLCLLVNGTGKMNNETLKRLCLATQLTPNDLIDWEKWFKDANLKPKMIVTE